MSAVERVQAAIDKLTKLKADSTPGPWLAWKQYDPLRGEVYGIEACEVDIIRLRSYNRADAELLEALHRTIDAQLAILRNAVGHFPQFFMSSDVELSWLLKRPSSRDAVTLADAILGADS